MAPFHPLGDNPNLSYHRDLELMEWLDFLGYDEAWIGEHHSAGWETIPSPELFIAAAIERTKTLRLGSGVTSVPYHHPLMVANRYIQLDHHSRGRTMLGIGRLPTRAQKGSGLRMSLSRGPRAFKKARSRLSACSRLTGVAPMEVLIRTRMSNRGGIKSL